MNGGLMKRTILCGMSHWNRLVVDLDSGKEEKNQDLVFSGMAKLNFSSVLKTKRTYNTL